MTTAFALSATPRLAFPAIIRRPSRAAVLTLAAALGAVGALTVAHALLLRSPALTGDAAFVQSITDAAPSFAFRAHETVGGRTTLVLSATATGVAMTDGATKQVLASGPHRPGPIVITGSPGDDTLVIDMTHGNPVPAAGLLFRGEGHTTRTGNVMEIRGGQFHTAVYDYSSPNDGVVKLDGTRIAYQGLQPLTNVGTAADVVFNLPVGSDSQAVLQDGPTATMAELSSTNHTFEVTDFTIPTSSLTINSSNGDDVTLNVTPTHSFGAASVTVDIPDAIHADALTTTGVLTMTVFNGIDQPAAGGLVVGSVAAKAGTGVVIPDDNKMTKLEAETDTGNLYIKNKTALTIGGVTGSLHGLRANGPTGTIFLESLGTITATTNGDLIRAPGDITVRSNAGDVTIGGQTTFDAVRSTGSGLVNIVGGTVFLGTATGTGNVDSVSGSINLGGVNNTIIDYGSGVFVGGGSGDLSVITSTFDLRLRATGGVTGAQIRNFGTGKVLVLAPNMILDSGIGGGIESAGGDLTIHANSMTIKNAISAGTGRVTLAQFDTLPTLKVDLGGAGAGTRLSLPDAAIDHVTAGVLTIGRTDNAGNMRVTAAITRHAGFATLDLESGADIDQSAPLSVPNLKVGAVGAANLFDPANDVDTMAAGLATSGQGFALLDGANLSIGTVDGTTGVTTNGGVVQLQVTTGNLVVQQAVSAGDNTVNLSDTAAEGLVQSLAAISTTGGHQVTLQAARMDLASGTITAAGGGKVTLAAGSARPVNLGPTTDPTGSLNLSDAELDTITTSGVVTIGSGFEGLVTGTAPIDAETHYGALKIDNALGILDHSSISVPKLLLRSDKAIVADGANAVSTLAGKVANPGAGFCFDFTGTRPTLGTVDNLTGVTTNNGPIAINPVADGCKVVTQLAFATAPVTGPASTTANLGPITVQAESSSGQPVPTPTDLTVNLASSTSGTPALSATHNGTAVTSVTIPAGSMDASFFYGDTKSGHPTITASSTGVVSATQIETITGGTPVAVKFLNGPFTGMVDDGADLGPIMLGVLDTLGNEALVPAGGIPISLASSSSGTPIFATTFAGTPITSITVPAGSNPVQLFYGDTAAGHPVLTASSPGLTSATQTETITAITFGAAVGHTSTLHIIIYTNTTNGAVNIGKLSTTNPVFVIVNDSCSGRGLGSGGSCRVQIAFKPTTTGTQTGQLVIPSTGGTVRLDLTGTGV